MATGDLVTQDWQMEYRGLALGDATNLALVQVEGLLDLPALTTSDTQRLRRHGLTAGDDFMGSREVTLTLEAWSEDSTSQSALLGSLAGVLAPGEAEAPLVFRLPGVAGGGVRRIGARVRKYSSPQNLDYLYGLPVVTMTLEAMDPRIYDNAASTVATTLPSTGGGLGFPTPAPLTFGAVSTGGSIAAPNAGNIATPVVFRVDGPCVNPTITNVGTGAALAFSVSLAAGEFLLVDSATRSVYLNGTANRYNTITSAGWFDLAPGVTQVDFRASTATSSTLTATWRSAWV